MKINTSELKTATGEPYDPKKHFIRRRNGKLLVFSRTIRKWQRVHKKKGCLKNSTHTGNQEWMRKKFMEKLGMS